MKNIWFNSFDLQLLNTRAGQIDAINTATRARSKKFAQNKTEFQLHYEGQMGEYAVAKYCGLEREYMSQPVHAGGDDGIDMVINGYRCHIKSTTRSPAIAFVTNMDAFTAPVGIFTFINSPVSVCILGMVGRDKFERCCYTRDFGYGDRLAIQQRDLTDISVLFDTGSGDTQPLLVSAESTQTQHT